MSALVRFIEDERPIPEPLSARQALASYRQAMRGYHSRSRTVAANWRARELAALRSIEHRRRNPSSENARPVYRADNYMRFVYVDALRLARMKAREAGFYIP